MARLGDLCKIQSGGTPSRSNISYWKNGTVPWVKISDIHGKYLNDVEEHITEEGLANSSAKIFPRETILYTIFATLGDVCVLNIDAATNQAIAGIQITSDLVDADYLYYYLSSLKTKVNNMGRGVAQNNINMTMLRDFEIPLPPLDEQRKIAAVLDKISDLIAKRRRQLDKLDELVKSKFVELFGDPVVNEKNWPKYQISDFALVKIGPFGSMLHADDYVLGEHPLVNPSHISDGVITPDFSLSLNSQKQKELAAYRLLLGDVIIGRRGEIGRCAVVRTSGMFCGTGCMFVRVFKDCRPDYLQHVISYPTFSSVLEDKSVGVTMKNLNAGMIEDSTIYLPPMSMQNEFASFRNQVDTLKLRIESSVDKIETLKKSLMQEYFSTR